MCRCWPKSEMKRFRKIFASTDVGRVVLVGALIATFASIASACPNCKESLADPQQHSMATGYYYSILFMMSMPFAILGTFGSLAYLSIRRARAQQEAERTSHEA